MELEHFLWLLTGAVITFTLTQLWRLYKFNVSDKEERLEAIARAKDFAYNNLRPFHTYEGMTQGPQKIPFTIDLPAKSPEEIYEDTRKLLEQQEGSTWTRVMYLNDSMTVVPFDCVYNMVWTEETGHVFVCKLHGQNSKHLIRAGQPLPPCLEIDPYTDEDLAVETEEEPYG